MDNHTYTWDDMERQLADWHDAAVALRDGDATGIVTALAHYGDDRDEQIVYREVLAMVALGSHLTAAQIIRVQSGATCPPPPGQKYALYARVPDPSIEASATERIATSAVLAASTGDLCAVADMAMSYAGDVKFPGGAGMQRLADLTMTLLKMYVIFSGMEPES